MTDAQTRETTGTNPLAPAPQGVRTAADVVTPELVAQLTKGVAGSGRTANHTPFTGEKLADLPESTPEDVAKAFEAARAAQAVWARVPVRERAAVLLRFHDLVLSRQAEVLDLVQLETGKARLHAHEEVQAVAVAARHYGRRAAAYLRPKRHTGAVPVLTKVTELRHPRGVIGQIAPWNYPLELSVGDALPAFVAGNAVVMKPDTETCLTALWARDLLIEAGLPADVFQVVLGEGPVVGPEVVRHADYVSFTGSTRTGREVAQGAAARLVGVSSNSAARTPCWCWGTPTWTRRRRRPRLLLLRRPALHLHRAALRPRVGRRRLPGALRRPHQGAASGHRPRLRRRHGLPGRAAPAGRGDPARRGRRRQGRQGPRRGTARPDIGPYFYEPTILDGVEAPMSVCTEETFGPVVSVYRFSSEDEAVERANGTPYGLNSSVWTKNARRGREIAARLRTGTVNVNEGYAPAYGSVQSPMGGMKDSGLGRRHGSEGILKYTEAQTVAQQRLLPMAPSLGMDDEKYAAFMSRSLRLMKAFRFR